MVFLGGMVPQVWMEPMALEDFLDLLGLLDQRELKDLLDPLDLKDLVDQRDLKDPLDKRELKDLLDPLDLKDPLVLKVEGPSTHGGERALVHKYRVLSCSTPASLEEHTTINREVEPTTCACLRTQSIAPPSHIKLDHNSLPYMVQSMRVPCKARMKQTHLALCATCLLDQL